MYRFVKSRFPSTALALKSPDIKKCGSEFYLVFFFTMTMYNSWGDILLFYFIAWEKGHY